MAGVRERLLRATAALRAAGIPHAVVGGNAVATWVGNIDPSQIRNTRDVDILVNRADFPAIKVAMESAGFVHWDGSGFDVFRDGPTGMPGEGVHLLYARERVFGDDALLLPDLSASQDAEDFRVISLEALVGMKLIANRDKDRTHLRDLIGVGLVDRSWIDKYPPVLAARLKHVLDTPNG